MPLDQIDVENLPENPGSEMSFLDHLEQLRWHLIRSIISIMLVAAIVFLFKDFVFGVIILGPVKDYFPTYQVLCSIADFICIRSEQPIEIITRALGEQFIVHLKSSIWIGLIVAFPYVLWELWRFIKPGLYKEEQKAARGLVTICSLLFILGVLFGYYIIAPFAVSFLASYTVDAQIANTVTLTSFVNYMTMFTIPTGIVFELPIVVYFLARIGLITASFMRQYRRYAIIVIFILASIITPPDVITQFLIAIPLLILYEISISIAKRQEKKLKAK